jgi:hypothetical protein
MATIRVRDWTKAQIEEIREAESHSSHDSVIKSLLKDRKLAQFAGTAVDDVTTDRDGPADDPAAEPAVDKPFDDLTVLAELTQPANGVLFLWCPNCPNEMAHIGFDDPGSITALEMKCQQCLTRLDEHAVVEIDVGYPLEERVVEGTLHDDLRACVIDYWDRTLETAEADDDVDADGLVRTIDGYVREFGWTWPTDVPAVALQPGTRYRNEATGECFDVLETVAGDAGADAAPVDAYRIRTISDDDTDGDATAGDTTDGESTVLTGADVAALVLGRELTVLGDVGSGSGAGTASDIGGHGVPPESERRSE